MAFNASEFHGYYQLKPCALRVHLRAHGVEPAEPDDYHKLLERLGRRHEERHLATLGDYVNADGRVEATRDAVTPGRAGHLSARDAGRERCARRGRRRAGLLYSGR